MLSNCKCSSMGKFMQAIYEGIISEFTKYILRINNHEAFITVQSTTRFWFNEQLGSRNHFTSMSHKPLSATTCQISLPWIRRPHSFRRFSSPASPP